MFRMLHVSVVCDSRGGAFSLSELMFLGSLKIFGLYSNSVGVGSHGPESDVALESWTFFRERESSLLLELTSLLFVCLSHGLYFSVLFHGLLLVYAYLT